eukprot:TRINITY_DN3388_c0_g1_i5.p1 TRINITY_DN3388_c0_g1~~TRINITY_DN3388_c0_g1_i5.p1  ORF type:complete len:266 (+),score=64.29 TRINITY_DN3388_c0_g1_i5:46-843(+)
MHGHALLAAVLCAAVPSAVAVTQVACVGDSITGGECSSGPTKSYPAQLQVLLDAKFPGKYSVANFGVPGRTAMKQGEYSYWKEQRFQDSLASNASIVIVMFGTNDANSFNWGPHSAEFGPDYNDLTTLYKNMPSAPSVYIMTPPPMYKEWQYGINNTVTNVVYPTLIPQLAQQYSLKGPVDVFNALGGANLAHPELFADFCHPNDAGYLKLAQTVFDALVAEATATEAPPTPAPPTDKSSQPVAAGHKSTKPIKTAYSNLLPMLD